MADRRLGEAEPLAGAGHAALLDQGIENAQQIQIEIVKMKAPHGCNATLSFAWTSQPRQIGVGSFTTYLEKLV
jgi:aromatic ring hydroxylase